MQFSSVARTLRKRPTWAEKKLWQLLRSRRFAGYKFRRQHTIESYILDFYCPEARLNIELDGFGHGYPLAPKRDAQRDTFLELKGIYVKRFWNHQLANELDVVEAAIWQLLQARSPHRDNKAPRDR